MSKFIVFKTINDMPELAVSSGSMSWNKTGSWRSSTPLHIDKTPPCNFNCPAGENIRGYIDLLKHYQTAEAFELLTSANPLPAVCGRVCFHPCQAHCNRHGFDLAIQVRLLEKFIGDWGLEQAPTKPLPQTSGRKVAVIGAGPAGLAAAYYLRRKGVAVTMYDDHALPGGILEYGIPAYRLEKDVLQAELTRVLTGIEFHPGMKFGRDFDIGALVEYDAVFLATGAHQSKRLHIEGENIPGVESGLGFLQQLNSGEKIDVQSHNVLVIGGGNTACDVARSAYRLGAHVTLLYRRTEREMPAFAEEIEQLRAEPIHCEFLVAPERITRAENGTLTLTAIRMKLGEPDESGRARPVAIEGSQFTLIADRIFAAIGEDPDVSFFPNAQQHDDGEFDFSGVDARLAGKLFVGGDLLPNPRTVPHAVGSGRLAAEKILAQLRGEPLVAHDCVVEVAGPEDINYRYFTRINAVKWQTGLAAGGALSEQSAHAEAERCFSCGVCSKCDNCFNFCPDLAVIKSAGGYQVNLEYCKGCGICAAECPGGSLRMRQQ